MLRPMRGNRKADGEALARLQSRWNRFWFRLTVRFVLQFSRGQLGPPNAMETRLIWINLLVKLGVAAAVSSSLVRSVEFKSLLFREERSLRQKIYLVLWFGLPITVGVWIRFSAKSFLAGDLSFETALLLGVIGGRWAGVLGGVLMALPALLHGEWATLPFGVLCGFIAGQLRTMAR